jgi:hypothetical protein
LARPQKVSDIFHHEVQGLDARQSIDVAAPQCIARVANLACAEVRESLARWSTNNDVGGRYASPKPYGDVALEDFNAAMVCAVRGRCKRVVLECGDRLEPIISGETLGEAAGARKQIDDGEGGGGHRRSVWVPTDAF